MELFLSRRRLPIFIVWVLLNLGATKANCGFESCTTSDPFSINVHLVPHSHDDVGWLKTVEQYYYGSHNEIQRAGVQYILDTVVEELLKDPKRRFIQVETFFFAKWYSEQTAVVQKAVKKLVDEGRLEFAGGAWSMNDEAAVHYQSVIDQFNLGLKYIKNIFGNCARPNAGWQIDPFGHSREMASIFAQMGYHGEFFARMDYVDKTNRLKDRRMEMIWKSSDYLKNSEIFTGLLYNHYSAPPSFCFDVLCNDAPIVDGDNFDNNIDERVDQFIAYIKSMAKSFRTNSLLVPMGDDFQYSVAAMNFKNMDKLIKYVNDRQRNGSNINVFYSTPSCYLYNLRQVHEIWPTKTQDFFPYSSDSNSYWTGYFTSRPTQKRFIRDGNHFLQVVKQLGVLANLTSDQQLAKLDHLNQAMGIMQHHDAVTGTEKQAVAWDYDRLLHEAIIGAENNAQDALRTLTNLTSGEFVSCLTLNISVCEFTQKTANNVIVTLVNPMGHASTQYVRIPVKNENYIVTDQKGREIFSEVVPLPWQVLNLQHRPNDTQHELVFKANVEKLANFYIRVLPFPKIEQHEYLKLKMYNNSEAADESNEQIVGDSHEYLPIDDEVSNNRKAIYESNELIVENSLIKLVFDSAKGGLKAIEMNGVRENIQQNFGIYKGFQGSNKNSKDRSSGAYIFRPDGDINMLNETVILAFYNGSQVKEVHQHWRDEISQVVRIYEGVNRVEFEWLVGPINTEDFGKEIITRFTSEISSNGKFYTDSNGREILERQRNKREDFEPDMTEAISGNYYPVTAQISLQDDKKRITLLNDRSQGGASLADGELELMLHRRLLNDDAFGVGEALNEEQFGTGLIARGKIYLVLDEAAAKPKTADRLLQHELSLPFWKFFSKSNKAVSINREMFPDFTDLPRSVDILTLEQHSKNEILLRLENFDTEKNVVSFNIYGIFAFFNGDYIWETTLDGNMQLSEMKRIKYPQKYFEAPHKPLEAEYFMDASEFVVTLESMQIRTFIIQQKANI